MIPRHWNSFGDLNTVMEEPTGTAERYKHFPLNIPMDVGAGSYWISGEDRVPLAGREVLCIVRDTDCITSCCGQSEGFRSIGVLGYIVEWHSEIEDGYPVSRVESITDEAHRIQLIQLLQQKYRTAQIEFL
jgi:hypothetical protein